MAKVNKQEEILDNAEMQTKSFFTKHSKKIIATIVTLLVIGLGIALWYLLWVLPHEHEAQVKGFPAQAQFENARSQDEYAAALKKSENSIGFELLAKEYESTPMGNLANVYAAACALRTGDLEAATKFINAFEALDQENEFGATINALVLCLKGDIAVDKGSYAEAAKQYEQAAKHVDEYSTPVALYKLALVYKAQGNEDKANATLTKIIELYPASYQANEAIKLVK